MCGLPLLHYHSRRNEYLTGNMQMNNVWFVRYLRKTEKIVFLVLRLPGRIFLSEQDKNLYKIRAKSTVKYGPVVTQSITTSTEERVDLLEKEQHVSVIKEKNLNNRVEILIKSPGNVYKILKYNFDVSLGN